MKADRRLPMYVVTAILAAVVPLALGSYWVLLLLVSLLVVLVVRIRDEENLLEQELTGYRQYAAEVRYRLLPCVW